MSLSVAELKKVSVQSIRDISAGLRAKAASMRATKAGVSDLPHKGTWTGVSADNADREIGAFGKGLATGADAYEDAATKVDRAGDEFEGLKQLLDKLENEAAGKFAINEATGEVTPLSKDFNKADRDYIANTLKQLCAAGGQANDELAAGIHATDAAGAPAGTNPAGAPPVAAQDSNFYKDWYRKTDAPASTQVAAATATDPNAPVLGPASPDSKPVPADGKPTAPIGGLTGQLQSINDPNKPPAKPVYDPKKVGSLGGSVDFVKDNSTPIPEPEPGFGEETAKRIQAGFNESLDGTIQGAKNLVGLGGEGAPGVAESWGDLAKGSAEGAVKYGLVPMWGMLEDAQHAIDDPGHFAGQKLYDGVSTVAGGVAGGEAAAIRHGLMDGLDHPAPAIDHPAPTVDHTPAVEHDLPSVDTPLTPIDHPHIDSGGGSTYKERIDQTPVNNGSWAGDRGESQWISDNPSVNQFLKEAGVDGIHYSNGRPDFSPIMKGQVELPEMTTNRDLNFKLSDKLLADQWGVSPRDVFDWRKENGYTWHEEPDLKTMQLVPSIVNNRLGHVGGIGELNRGAVPPVGGNGS